MGRRYRFFDLEGHRVFRRFGRPPSCPRLARGSLASMLVLVILGAGSAYGQDDAIACAAEARWLSCPERVAFGAEAHGVVLHLLGQISSPRSMCLPADVHLTAAYLDAEGQVLCSGVLEEIATLKSQVQTVAVELDPSVLRNFARWLNQPDRQSDPPFTPLHCLAPNGRIELLDSHIAEAFTLSVTATLLPETGGVASAECRLLLAN